MKIGLSVRYEELPQISIDLFRTETETKFRTLSSYTQFKEPLKQPNFKIKSSLIYIKDGTSANHNKNSSPFFDDVTTEYAKF